MCGNCGGSVKLARAGARFCSTRCRVAAHRRRVPESLARLHRWTRADGKRPVTVSGDPASSTDPATWASFATVQAGAGDGFGVMLGDGLGCLDLDHCLDGDVLAGWARERMDALRVPVLFIERSVSGAGLHVFTAEPEGRSVQGGWGGHYRHSRFIRVTGARFDL